MIGSFLFLVSLLLDILSDRIDTGAACRTDEIAGTPESVSPEPVTVLISVSCSYGLGQLRLKTADAS